MASVVLYSGDLYIVEASLKEILNLERIKAISLPSFDVVDDFKSRF